MAWQASAEEGPTDEQRECANAYEVSQELRLANQLLASREQLRICSREICREFIGKACSQWLNEVSATIATVAFDVYQGGRPITEFEVFENGKALPVRADGDPVEVNPGGHLFELRIAGAAPMQRQVALQAGERNRLVRVIFPVPAAAPAPPTKEPPPEKSPWPSIFLGVGAVGVTTFAGLGVWGMNREDDLRSQCAPNCSSQDVSSIRRQYLAADIALGVGVAALAVGTVLWLGESSEPKQSSSSRWRIGLAPTQSGATGQLRGSF